MILTKAQPIILRALWIAVSFISSIWFLYWICYDVFVWNKLLAQVRPQNYFGLILSIVAMILGTQLEKTGISRKLMFLTAQIRKNARTKTKQQIQQIQQEPKEELLQPIEPTQQIQPDTAEERKILRDFKIPGCKFYLGYLHKRPKSVEIPEDCLECGYVVNCLSPTARNVEIPVTNF